jgi:dipeptidyl-peptidase 4
MKPIRRLIFLVFLVLLAIEVQGQRQIASIMDGFPEALNPPPLDGDHPEAKVLGPGLFGHIQPIREQYSPVSDLFAGTQEGRFYIRNSNSDKFLFSLPPEEGFYWHMDNALWSPDGRYLIAKQIDDLDVPEIKLEGAKPEETTFKKYSRAGQNIPIHQFYLVDSKSGKALKIEQKAEHPYVHVLEWSKASDQVFLLSSDRLMKEVHLQRIDALTGKATLMLAEKADTYLIGLDLLQGYSNRLQRRNLVTFLEDKEQFTWMSERSGYSQIYLYDFNGSLIRPLTNYPENGEVSFLEHIDDEKELIYFLAHSNPEKPYELQLFNTDLNQAQITKLVDTPGVMELHLPSGNDTLWVLRSKLPSTLQVDRYSPEGKYYDTPWKGNFSEIGENYFNFEYVTAKAADGKTPLQALILKPSDFDPNKIYPVVEYIYGANFVNVVPRHLFEPPLWEMNSLAQEGFITVFIDGRGTPGRGKAFKDFSYGKFGQVELDDHIAVLKQISKDRSYMNMEQIGILGHSWGGYFALRALMDAPDFYKAGHINAPAIEPSQFRVAIEPFMGCLPQNCPELYSKSSILDKLGNLKAPLMIVHGTADDDVPIDDSYKLIRLLDQMKYEDYEFIPYKGMDHIVMRNPEWLPNMIRFFEKHLK